MENTVEQKEKTAEKTEVKIEPELTIEDYEKALGNVVDKAVEKLNVISKEAKIPAVQTEKPEIKTPTQRENGMKVKEWFSGNLNKGWNEKGLIEGEPSTGSTVAVPQILNEEILRQMDETGVTRQFATKIPMTSQVLLFTVTDTEPEGIWGSQATATDSTHATYEQVTFTREPLMVKALVSNPLLQDASNFVKHLAGIGATGIRKAEDRETVALLTSASGTHEVKLSGTLTQGALTFAKVGELVNAGSYQRTGNERLFMHRNTWSQFATLTTGTAGYPVAGTDNWLNPNFKGIPVSFMSSMTDYVTSDGTAKVYAFYCDLSQAVGLGVRTDEAVAMRMSDSAVVGGVSAWDTDQTAIKYQVDEDIEVLRPKYVAKLVSAH